MISKKNNLLIFNSFIILFLFLWPLKALSENTLFFYNPEANINDFRSLKTVFDSYLATKGTYQFQPFNDKKTFESFLNRQKKDIFLLSSWHYQELKAQGYSHFKPILVGTINGMFTYTQVLSTKKQIRDIGALQGKRIASASNRDYTQKMLKSMVIQQQPSIHNSFKVLTVPKDIDALMSVLFGMAQGALTARNSLDTLAKINPRKYRLLHQQAESSAIMLPLVIADPQFLSRTNQQKLLNAVEKMQYSKQGQEILGMLGLNGWKKLTRADLRWLSSTTK
jgi:hypothetical protein